MTEHIDKIVDDHIQVIVHQVMDIVHEIKTCLIVDYFGIGYPKPIHF